MMTGRTRQDFLSTTSAGPNSVFGTIDRNAAASLHSYIPDGESATADYDIATGESGELFICVAFRGIC